MTAETEITEALEAGESVAAVVIGKWGGSSWEGEQFGYCEPCVDGMDEDDEGAEPVIPFAVRGKVLTWEEAVPYLQHWKTCGGYGSVESYGLHIYTKKKGKAGFHRIGAVCQYDGASWLYWVPAQPTHGVLPNIVGGG